MDADGTIYMLEINPNCGIFYPPSEPGSADFSLLNDSINHTKFMKLMIRSAQRRQARMVAEKMLRRQNRKRAVEVEQMAYS
jgi:D-alanine-D-alanine ligase